MIRGSRIWIGIGSAIIQLLDPDPTPHKIEILHCKSDGDNIQTCFTKLVCNTTEVYFFICYLTIQLVKLAGIPRCISYIDVKSRLNRRSGEEGRELPPTPAWRQFPTLLSAPVVELRVLSRNAGKYIGCLASTLVDDGKSLFLWGDELIFLCRL